MTDELTYCILTKPSALSMQDWATVLKSLQQVLAKRADSPQPVERLHWRFSLDKTALLLHGIVDTADVDAVDLTRLAGYVRTALDNKYTVSQTKTALANNVKVMSHAEVLAYLSQNRAAWEPEEEAGPVMAVGDRSEG